MIRFVFVFILTAFVSLQCLSLDPGEYSYDGKLLAGTITPAVDINVSFVYKDGEFSNARFFNLSTGIEMPMKISGNESSITMSQQTSATKYTIALWFDSVNRLVGTATRNNRTQKVELRLTHLVKYVKHKPEQIVQPAEHVAAVVPKESESTVSDPAHYSAQVRQQGDAYSRPSNQRADNTSQEKVRAVQATSNEKPVDQKIYDMADVEQLPEFPGGEAAMYKWLSENIQYPSAAAEEGADGRVTVKFIVSRTGDIKNVSIVRGRHPALDKEAVRVVKSMPRWEPGRYNGEPVIVTFLLPVIFRLQK